MLRRIRTALIEHHVGAIAIGVLIAQMTLQLVTGIAQPIGYYVYSRLQGRDPGGEGWTWMVVLAPVIGTVLYLAAILVLVHWLYLPQVEAAAPPDEAEE